MPVAESMQFYNRPGDSTGVGVNFANVDVVNGVQAVSPSKHKQDGNILHDKEPFVISFLSAPTAGGYILMAVAEGIWVVDSVLYSQITAGTSPTIDVLWVAPATAVSGGTTQLTGVIDASVGGNNTKDVRGTLIAAPTQAGPGNRLAVNIGGTTTSMVGTVTVNTKRIV